MATTVIDNAAREPEIVDLADCLVKMGARIDGRGHARASSSRASTSLGGARHAVLPDRIETGTYAMAVGHDRRRRAARRHAARPAAGRRSTSLAHAGVEVTATNERHSRSPQRRRHRARRCRRREPFPGFPTDLQAQFMALMTRADGTSHIRETIFENRFMHVQELARLGARIRLDGDPASSRASPG